MAWIAHIPFSLWLGVTGLGTGAMLSLTLMLIIPKAMGISRWTEDQIAFVLLFGWGVDAIFIARGFSP